MTATPRLAAMLLVLAAPHAARACAQMGHAGKAVEWIRSIPSRFLPPDVQPDPALTSLHGRADFQALFKR
jgi:hypothetical protein